MQECDMDRPNTSSGLPQPPLADDLARHGIVAVQLMSYEWSGYRYSNASDALAAAERAAR